GSTHLHLHLPLLSFPPPYFDILFSLFSSLFFFFRFWNIYPAASYSSRVGFQITPSRYPLRHFPNFQGKEKAEITAVGF
ncbi:hypothetical protein TorRG33x02_089910, partial [Trema orientale]